MCDQFCVAFTSILHFSDHFLHLSVVMRCPQGLMQTAMHGEEMVLQAVFGQTGAEQAGREQQQHAGTVCWKALQNLLTSAL